MSSGDLAVEGECMHRILVVEDDRTAREGLVECLSGQGMVACGAGTAEEALARLHQFEPDVVLTDVNMGPMSGLELLRTLQKRAPEIDVIVVTGREDMRTAVESIRDGAYDYLVKPVPMEEITQVVERCFRDRSLRERTARAGVPAEVEPCAMVGSSPSIVEIFKRIGMLATARAPVLVRGETGTGKELIARAIHRFSPWHADPFVAINCSALTESLLESELFGHVRGAFTGAVSDRKGRFEMAGTGTIFLDEIGDTSPAFQSKLLRVLQEREFYPVGGDEPRRTRARVIAATHRPIEELVAEGRFREDLYFRLRVVELVVPPLRERRSDIPQIARHLLAKVSRELQKEVSVIPPATMQALQESPWPGNVREMENAILRAVVLAHGPAIREEDLALDGVPNGNGNGNSGKAHDPTLQTAERHHVGRILESTGGNKSMASRLLGISRPRLDRILRSAEAGLLVH
jgi:DNA-binding NtrC family response regulator